MRYDTERCAVVASVSEVCDLVFRSGDLDSRRQTAAQDLSKFRSELEKNKGALYNREKPVLNTSKYGELYYEISGTVHGAYFGDKIPIVEKVKAVGRNAR